MSNEKGQALLLVLIALTVGALFITPFLGHVSTSLIGSRIDRELRIERYSAEAGIENAIWRLKHEVGFADTLTEANPSAEYSITVNNTTVPITATKILFAYNVEEPAVLERSYVDNSWDQSSFVAGETIIFTLTIYIYNEGPSAVHLEEVGDLLPPGFSYLTNTSSGLTTDDPVVSEVDGKQELVWAFTPPQPKMEALEMRTQSFQVTATPGGGTYYNHSWVVLGPESQGTISTGSPGSTEGTGAPRYDIEAGAGSVTIRASIEITETDFTILSWQIE